jgi:hypothetical protein
MPSASSICSTSFPISDRARDQRRRHVRSLHRQRIPKGSFEAIGVDRIIAPNGYVAENLIISDHPIFADFAMHVGDLRGA